MADKLFKHTKKTKNLNTGEVIDEEKYFAVPVRDYKYFYITYIDNISGFLKIKNTIDMRVLALLCCSANLNTGEINLTRGKRKEIQDALDISTQNMSNILTRLRKLTLISGNNGDYLINPNCFWRGSEAKRLEMLNTTGVHFKLSFTIDEGLADEDDANIKGYLKDRKK